MHVLANEIKFLFYWTILNENDLFENCYRNDNLFKDVGRKCPPPHFGWKCPTNPLENNKKLQIPLKNFFLRIQLNKEILAGICTFFEYLLKICKKTTDTSQFIFKFNWIQWREGRGIFTQSEGGGIFGVRG